MDKIIIDQMTPSEYPLLSDFLYQAIFVKNPNLVIPKSVTENPSVRVYIENFGALPDDFCLCARTRGIIIGAVWTRIIDGYGHIDDETPEFAISLKKEYRGMGIGTRLMNEMLLLLKQKGYKSASLSVQKDNYAIKLYLSCGFTIYKDCGEDYLMKIELNH